MKKIALVAAALAATTGLSAAPAATVATVDTQSNSVHQSKANTNQKAKGRSSKAIRLTSSASYRNRWLIPVNKESFKQGRRKQLAKRSLKKAKKQGRA